MQYRINTGTVVANANNGVIHFETNIVASSTDQRTYNVWYHLDYQNIITCAASVSGITVASKNLSYAVTNWTSQSGQTTLYNSTLTYYGDVVLKGFTSGQQVYFTCAVGSDNYSFYYGGWHDFITNRIYFEQNPMSINWTNNETDTLINIQINQDNEYYQSNYGAVDNINNQTDSQFGDISSPTTSNLIGLFTSFINAVSTIQAADSCEITLPFPSFAGGSWVVNPCQNKEKIPQVVLALGTIVTICFVMGAWNWISIKIYRLIRSFIDGSDDTEGEDNG